MSKNNSLFKIVWFKAFLAFQIPFFTALVAALTPYTLGGVAIPASYFLRFLLVIVILATALVAGYSGVSSFLSTTFSEHKAKQEAGLPDTAPVPITGAQVANTPPAPMPPAAPVPTVKEI